MLKKLLIGLVFVTFVALIFIFPGELMSSDDLNSYTLNKAYLAKNKESYARCYNSVNYGASVLIDIELSLKSEYFNDPRVSSEKMKEAEISFMNIIKKKSNKTINDYESAYKNIEDIRNKSVSLKAGWRTFVFSGKDQSITFNEIYLYSPTSAHMTVAFNDYIFTTNEAKMFYMEQLSL